MSRGEPNAHSELEITCVVEPLFEDRVVTYMQCVDREGSTGELAQTVAGLAVTVMILGPLQPST